MTRSSLLTLATTLLAAALLAPLTSLAQAQALAEAEVRRVDRAQGKVTLRHGPIPSLEMPPMTMVFRVAEPAMLDQLREGEKIRFDAEQRQGQYVITRIER